VVLGLGQNMHTEAKNFPQELELVSL